VSQFLTQYGPQLIGEFFNVDDIKACFSGKILSCLILVAEQLGPVRAFKALKLLYKATKAVKSFWDAVKKARKVIRNVTKKIDACQQGLVKEIAGDLVSGAAGAAAKARAAVAAGPKKKCKVDFPDSCEDDFAGRAPAVGRLNADCTCETAIDKRHIYLPMANSRPQGARATICKGDLKETGSPKDVIAHVFVAGWPDDNPKVDNVHTWNRAHILGDKFGGLPITQNLFPGYWQMNLSGMKRCEYKMLKSIVKDNEIVIYSGQLRYDSSSLIPSGIRMVGSTKSGKYLFDQDVPNKPMKSKSCK
jgi:hypothetical protein